MATRLLSEYLVKKHYPHLRYVRIHTAGKNTAVIYAWNEELELPEKDMDGLRKFASGYLSPYVCFKVKSYRMVQADRVPRAPDLPESVTEAAMSRSLDQHGILRLINGMLMHGAMSFDRYDPETGILHFEVRTIAMITEIEKELIDQYLYEVVPIGTPFEVHYG